METKSSSDRRDFLKTAGGAAVLGMVVPAVHASGSDVLRIGLIGCGGRGTGAAADALQADPNLQLVAMGDAFADQLSKSRDQLKRAGGSKFAVSDDRCFVGFDAYKQVIDSGIDVALLCTPPHFRPIHLRYAIERNKHVFCEKPVAVDAPGVRSVVESCAKAKSQGLAVVSGLCWRYHPGMQATVAKIHEGAIGNIVALQCNYNTGLLWHKERQPSWSDMEWQLRNWLYFTWLSGDHNVEQHVHSLDKMAWVMGDEYPIRCFGLGGRQSRTQPEYGHIFDHHAVCYEYASGLRCFAYCRQQANTANEVEDHVFGTKGTAHLIGHRIEGETKWKFRASRGQKVNMYQAEHDALFASIRAGSPINNGDYMSKSTLMGIMGRMATYTGQAITWEMAMNSKEDLTPSSGYVFGSLPLPPVAVPGVTKFV